MFHDTHKPLIFYFITNIYFYFSRNRKQNQCCLCLWTYRLQIFRSCHRNFCRTKQHSLYTNVCRQDDLYRRRVWQENQCLFTERWMFEWNSVIIAPRQQQKCIFYSKDNLMVADSLKSQTICNFVHRTIMKIPSKSKWTHTI